MARIFVFGDNIDTDSILPGRYLSITDDKELARHCMCGFEEGFALKVSPGDIFVAGKNFGCGSSREHAPAALRALGLRCVIARSFARIFYRNAINIGLAVLECPQAVDGIREGDSLEVDFDGGRIQNLTRGEEYPFAPFPPSIQSIIKAGGAINALKEKLKN